MHRTCGARETCARRRRYRVAFGCTGAPAESPWKNAPMSRARGVLRRLRYLPLIGYRRGPRLMSELRKSWVLFRHPHATIQFGRDVYLGPRFSLHMPLGGTLIVGDGVEFRRDFRAEFGNGPARIEIGAGSYLTYGVPIACSTTI